MISQYQAFQPRLGVCNFLDTYHNHRKIIFINEFKQVCNVKIVFLLKIVHKFVYKHCNHNLLDSFLFLSTQDFYYKFVVYTNLLNTLWSVLCPPDIPPLNYDKYYNWNLSYVIKVIFMLNSQKMHQKQLFHTQSIILFQYRTL